MVDVGAGDVHAAAQEVASPAVGVEAHDVVGEDALVERTADRLGQDPPVVRLRPWNVDEVGERGLRGVLPDDARRHVEVVVVEEHGRAGLAVELVEHSVGEARFTGTYPSVQAVCRPWSTFGELVRPHR